MAEPPTKKPRLRGVNLRALGEASTAEVRRDRFLSLQQPAAPQPAPVDHGVARAMQNVFVAAAGDDPGRACGIMHMLANKIGLDLNGGTVDATICDRLGDFLSNLRENPSTDANTLHQCLLSALCPTHTGRGQSDDASLAKLAHRLGVGEESMYGARERRIGYEDGKGWLKSIQPPGKNWKAVSPKEKELIRNASLSPEVSHPSGCKKYMDHKRKTPINFLNTAGVDGLDDIRKKINMDFCDRTIQLYMDPTVKVDNRVLTGMCIIHAKFRYFWVALGRFLKKWKAPGCKCRVCTSNHVHAPWNGMLLKLVCPFDEGEGAMTTLAAHFPALECCLGQCRSVLCQKDDSDIHCHCLLEGCRRKGGVACLVFHH
jgi:hypothetical protein